MKRTHVEVNDGGSWHSSPKRHHSSQYQYQNHHDANYDAQWQWKSRPWSWYHSCHSSWPQSHENDSSEWKLNKSWNGDGDYHNDDYHYYSSWTSNQYGQGQKGKDYSWQSNSWSWDEDGDGQRQCQSAFKSNYWSDCWCGDDPSQWKAWSWSAWDEPPKKNGILKVASSVPKPRKQVTFGTEDDNDWIMFDDHPEEEQWRKAVPTADPMEVLEPPDRWMYSRVYRERLLALMDGQTFLTSTLQKDEEWYHQVRVKYMKWLCDQVD